MPGTATSPAHTPVLPKLVTLGGLELIGSTFTRPKPLLLLAYLALEGPQDRRHLAELFWPGASSHMNSLTVALAQLRKGVPGVVGAEGQKVSARLEIDAGMFLAQLDDDPEAALTLYRGSFLEGFYLSAWGEELEEWVYTTRERLAGRAQDAHLRFAEALAAQGKFTEAARRAEAAYALRGGDALEPEDLERLHRLLIAGGSAYAAEVAEEAAVFDLTLVTAAEAKAQLQFTDERAVRTNLPAPATPFVGREAELTELERLLREPDCRLLSLSGPGGIGKTRLALEVAPKLMDVFQHGVYFVPLASVDSAEGIPAAVAEATGFRFYSDAPPQQQLHDFLREKEMLIVLDNAEQVRGAAALVSDFLSAAPRLKVIVTSRESLRLPEEWHFPLPGLSFPEEGEVEETYDALALFESCARRARVRFALGDKRAEVARICRLVEGNPLALELAAGWLHVLPVETIVEELARSTDILNTRHQSIDPRHQSMRAVLDGSWRLLKAPEQAVLARLSVFQGGFLRRAAEAVAGASLASLATLVEKSLLRVSKGGRFQLHGLLRHFVAEKLAEDREDDALSAERHSRYYTELLIAHQEDLVGRNQQQALARLAAELDNVRIAWYNLVARRDWASVDRAAEGLYHFLNIRGRYQLGEEVFAHTAENLAPFASADDELSALLNRVQARRAVFSFFLSAYQEAGEQLLLCLEAARRLEQARELAFITNFLGQLAAWRGDRTGAQALLKESLALSNEVGDKSGAAFALEKLANLSYATFGEYRESKALAEQSLELSRELGRPDWRAYALDTLGFVTFCLGEYGAAERYYRDSLGLFGASGDPYGRAMALGGIGLVLWAKGNKLAEAARCLEESLTLCRNIGHRGQSAGRLAGLARVANDLGEYEQARAYALEGLATAQRLNSPVYLSQLLCCLGETACALGDLTEARTRLTEALKLTTETGLLSHVTMALYDYGILLLGESEQEDAPDKQLEAATLFAFVAHHPACWQVIRARAEARLRELGTALSADSVTDAKRRGEHRSLDEIAAQLGLLEDPLC